MKKSMIMVWVFLFSMFFITPALGMSNQNALDFESQWKIYQILVQKMVREVIDGPDFFVERADINVSEAKKIIRMKNDKVKKLTNRNHEIVYYIPFTNSKNEPYSMVWEGDKDSGAIQYSGKMVKNQLPTYQEINQYIKEGLGDSPNARVAFYSIPMEEKRLMIAHIIKGDGQYIMSIDNENTERFVTGEIYEQEDFGAIWEFAQKRSKKYKFSLFRPLILTGITLLIVWPIKRLVSYIDQ